MAVLGWLCLVIAVGVATMGCAVGMVRPSAWRLLAACQWSTLAAVVASFAVLVGAMLNNDTSLAYVASHHAPISAAWGIRAAAVWAGQAGGLLLWCVEESFVSLGIRPSTQPRAVAVLLGLRAFLLILILFQSPFAAATPQAIGELNPMLNHTLMVIHPPMLFLGYAILAMPFAITIGALLDGAPQEWVPRVRRWLLIALLALTAGNGFGALWAYRTFGWGGFWSWDPVENTSFVPWMLVLIALHSLGARRWPSRIHWAAIASLAAFISVLYGSFLARSGLLGKASVHAYTEGEQLFTWALGLMIVISLALSGILLYKHWRRWVLPNTDGKPRHHTSALVLTGMSGIVVLVITGMTLPVWNIILATDDYNCLLLPLLLPLLLYFVWEPMTRLTTSRLRYSLSLGGICGIGIGTVVYLLPFFRGQHGWHPTMHLLFGAPLLATAIMAGLFLLWELGCTFRHQRFRGAILAHLGVAIFLLGTLLSGYTTRTVERYVPVMRDTTLSGHTIAVRRVTPATAERTEVALQIDHKPATAAIEFNQLFRTELRQVSIRHHLGFDLYVTPLILLPRTTTFQEGTVPAGALLAVSRIPGIIGVWLGIMLIAIGTITAIFQRQQRVEEKSRSKQLAEI